MDTNAIVGQFVTILLSSIILIAVPALTVVIVRFGIAKVKLIEAAIGEGRMQEFRDLVSMAVSAAEQSGLAGLIKNIGESKKAYALSVLQAIVDAKGWKIPVAQLEAEIENAIRQGWHQVEQEPAVDVCGTLSDQPVEEEEPAQPNTGPVSRLKLKRIGFIQ